MDTEIDTFHSLPPLEQVKRYHHRTKHDFNGYARSLGYLDWANQPDPFRRYKGAPLVKLPLLSPEEDPRSPSYEAIFRPDTILSQPVTVRTLSRFFEFALSLTAWKEYGGNRWALRSNPSSGNLHPTEGYLFLGSSPSPELASGLYHYAPKEHGLEHRWLVDSKTAERILGNTDPGEFLIGLSSIHWREAWKYGERAFRYCQHDTGHAIGTMRIAAATLGWRMTLLEDIPDDWVCNLLGISREQDFVNAEREYPELLAVVGPLSGQGFSPGHFSKVLSDSHLFSRGEWRGQANRLSKDDPIAWDIIDRVTEATWKGPHEGQRSHGTCELSVPDQEEERLTHSEAEKERTGMETYSPSAGRIIHQRRSAVAFDGKTGLSSERFFVMLERVLPQATLSLADRPLPWDTLPWEPTVHLALFVHRIEGLEPGLYWFNRHPERRPVSFFQSVMHGHFLWKIPDGCPQGLPLYLLEAGNGQQLAKQLSCWQDIAADGAFSLGMIAEFDSSLTHYGPWFYKRMFWETGLIGQVLYLEAEAAGVRSTGIGCFFDNPVHEVLGFHPQTTFQSLYHFTVGGPLDDGRLTTLPPYGDHQE